MIRRAALYVINKCKEEDEKKEAEIKARGDEKEIEAWFNGPRYHDIKFLNEAQAIVEDEFVRPVRDEQKRRKIYQMYRTIFRDLGSFKREIKSLSKHKPFKTQEVK
jgi:hypothetical protein